MIKKLIFLSLMVLKIFSQEKKKDLQPSSSSDDFTMLDKSDYDSQAKYTLDSSDELKKIQDDHNKRIEQLRTFFAQTAEQNNNAILKAIDALKKEHTDLSGAVASVNINMEVLKKHFDTESAQSKRNEESHSCCFCCLPFMQWFNKCKNNAKSKS